MKKVSNKSIKQWAEDDRPREKMLLKGIASLSNAELIAILINNGTKHLSAIDVSKHLLDCVGNQLTQLSKLSVKDILRLKVKGIGEAKAITIVAALELINRKNQEEATAVFVKSFDTAAQLFKAKIQSYSKEVFAVMYLNNALKMLHFEIISEGGIVATVVDVRIIFKQALLHNATNIIVAHNHPSGNCKPSQQDIQITEKINAMGKMMDIQLQDHIIITDKDTFSFKEEGLL